MTDLNINHKKLKDKMSTSEGHDINGLISFCVSYGYVDDMKRILKDYPDYKYDWVDILTGVLGQNKINMKIFKLIEPYIDWVNIHTQEFADGGSILKHIAYLLAGDGEKSLVKKALMKTILSKCTITDDVRYNLSLTNWCIEDFVVKFQDHIIENNDLYWGGNDWVDNILNAKVYDTKYHAEQANTTLKSKYYSTFIAVTKGINNVNS